jgi:hypothetical protein
MKTTTRGPARIYVVLLARALRPYVDSIPCVDEGGGGPTRAALEVARNAAQLLLEDDELDPYAVVADMLRHRMQHRWLSCGDVRSAARDGADVWSRIAARTRRAA